VPCRAQMPYINEIEENLTKKLKVIYISFDEDEIKWKKAISKKKKTGNQYRMINSFNSTFSKYFKLEEIPRYILVDKGGKTILNKKLPLTSQKNDFLDELKKVIIF